MQAGTVVLDRVFERIEGMAKACVRGLEPGQPRPGPGGCDKLMDTLQYLAVRGYEPDNGDKGNGERSKGRMHAQKRVSRDPECAAAVLHLVDETRTALEDFPEWHEKVLAILFEQFGVPPEFISSEDKSQEGEDGYKHGYEHMDVGGPPRGGGRRRQGAGAGKE